MASIKKTNVFLLLILSYSFQLQSQEINNAFNKVIEEYNNYFLLEPETFYTQINKDKYFNGESLWFKSYVYNTRALTPYFATTNINVSIYDSIGKLIEKKLFYAEEASTFGHFSIDNKYKPGKYYIKTSSNWMNNFNEDRSYIKEFEVLTDSKNNIIAKSNQPNTYDFKILPEGGHIVNNTINTFGFKIIDNKGHGVKIVSGNILTNNKLITSFKNNSLGIGKFIFFVEDDENYTVNFELKDGSIISKKIEKAETFGIAMSAENIFNKEHLIISLKTNKATLPKLLNKTHYLILNRDGFLKKIDVTFTNNKLDYSIRFKKELMIPGINILTLFNNEGQPISERLLFNPIGIKTTLLPEPEIIKEQDSSIIKYQLNKGIIGNKGSMSVSVLPNTTKAYKSNSSIISSFLLNPYIKGKIENPSFYFNSLNRKSLYNLDLLLTTQGWSKYSWNHIFYKPQYPLYDFEVGFKVKGKINNHKYNPKENIVLISKTNGIQLESKLFEDNSFEFKNLFIKDSSDIRFSLKKNKQTRPNIYFVLSPSFKKDSISITSSINNENTYKYENKSSLDFVYKSPVVLDTINLDGSNKSKKPKNRLLQGSSFGSKHISFEGNNRYSSASLVTDVIKDNGFDVYNTGLDVNIKSRRVLSKFSPVSPAVFIDNISQIDLRVLATMRISEVEEMNISQRGNLLGSAGAGGVIQIFTKTKFNNKSRSKFNSQISNYGFSNQKEYYSPLYDKSNNGVFSQFGVIHWNPVVKVDSEGSLVFKIPNYKSNKINLYIEGMCENGSLFSKLETVSLD